jgi:hypothetical protein
MSSHVSTEAHVASVAERGFTIIEDAIDTSLLDALQEALDRLERDLGVQPAGNSFEGAATWRIYNLLARDEVFWSVPVHPAVLPIVEGVLDPGCLVSSLSSIAIGPARRRNRSTPTTR